jgi:hypothetical protein
MPSVYRGWPVSGQYPTPPPTGGWVIPSANWVISPGRATGREPRFIGSGRGRGPFTRLARNRTVVRAGFSIQTLGLVACGIAVWQSWHHLLSGGWFGLFMAGAIIYVIGAVVLAAGIRRGPLVRIAVFFAVVIVAPVIIFLYILAHSSSDDSGGGD